MRPSPHQIVLLVMCTILFGLGYLFVNNAIAPKSFFERIVKSARIQYHNFAATPFMQKAKALLTKSTSSIQGKVNIGKHHSYKTPALTVFFIIDQGGYNPHFSVRGHLYKHGIREFLQHGIVYTSAYHEHGVPETTPGHHAISTGTLPRMHGAVYNQWPEHVVTTEVKDDITTSKYTINKVKYESDNDPASAVITSTGEHMPGKSYHNSKIDGIADHVHQEAIPGLDKKNIVYSLGLKSHPVISCASQLGKAIWFDSFSGGFVTSKKYFKTIPQWVVDFNSKKDYASMSSVTWKPFYSKSDPEYAKVYAGEFIDNYDFAACPSMIQQGVTPLNCKQPQYGKDKTPHKHPRNRGFDPFLRSPQASSDLFELAETCIKEIFSGSHTKEQAKNGAVLYICISNTDLAGHMWGPDARELIDLFLHVDKQIKNFMDFTNQFLRKKGLHALYVLTADHGVSPIPELAHLQGFKQARRIDANELKQKLNQKIKEKYDIEGLIHSFEPTFFTFDHNKLEKVSTEIKTAINSLIKDFLQKVPGIKRVWTQEELRNTAFINETDLESFYKNQLYPNRSGDIICMPEPNCQITSYKKGTSHSTPYEQDTHVPLIILFPNLKLHKVIADRVTIPQLPHTIARLLRMQPPSGANSTKVLPGIFGDGPGLLNVLN
jgi:predicted AlkP superfamily pyrophosphatase or phosphodiesterase